MLSRLRGARSIARAAGGVRSIATKEDAGIGARVCAVLGGQWGDEGKGKLADVLAKECVSRRAGAAARAAGSARASSNWR